MARDYKNSRRAGGSTGAGLWGGLVVGLLLGLSVALGVYLHDRRPGGVVEGLAPLAAEGGPGSEAPAPASQQAEPETQLDFYEMLPKFEVVVPQADRGAAANDRAAAGAAPSVDRPGTYLLQAGSFRNAADADRMRATLALQGIQSQIQRVAVDSDTWHRVRIGPITDLAKLEDTRRRLRETQVDALVLRLEE